MMTLKKYHKLAIATLLGIGTFLFLGSVLYDRETQNIRFEFTNDVDDKAAAFEREILLNLEVLYSIEGLFNSSGDVELHEFQTLTDSILSRHKNIRSLVWVPRIKGRSTARNNRTNYSNLSNSFSSKSESKMFEPLNNDVFPVHFIQPTEGNDQVIGYDIASDQQMFKVLERAKNTGKIQFSGKMKLFKQDRNDALFIAIPVYKQTPDLQEETRNDIKGFVLGVYEVEDLFLSATQRVSGNGIHLSLIDKSFDEESILYSSLVNAMNNENIYLDYSYHRKLYTFGDRQWILDGKLSEDYLTGRRTIFPEMFASLGSLLVFVMAFYNFVVIRHSESIEQVVEERTKELNEAKNTLENLSRTDSLTKIGNRRYFDEYIHQEWNRALRERTPLSLIMLDVDNFKLYNDRYGHAAGDECLKKVAQTLSRSINRTGDLVVRYGGEEFMVILPNTEDPFSIAETCRCEIEKLKIPHHDSKCSKYVTVSLGFSTIVPDINAKVSDLMYVADCYLYEAKDAGRNVSVGQTVQLKSESFVH